MPVCACVCVCFPDHRTDPHHFGLPDQPAPPAHVQSHVVWPTDLPWWFYPEGRHCRCAVRAHTHTHADMMMIYREKHPACHLSAVKPSPVEAAHISISSWDITDFIALLRLSSLRDTLVPRQPAVQPGPLFLGTPSHHSLQEDSLKTPNSLSPNDTLEASYSEPALQRLLVKEPVPQKKMGGVGWGVLGVVEREGEGTTESAFSSGRDWDARLWIRGVFN